MVSVYHKEGLDEIITKLHEEGVEFLSTGGTRQFIESLGYPCKAVEDLTTYPSILGGRVKTLHPKIFGGILCRRGLEQDMQQIEKYEIPEIDLVIVDLYPFEATVASGASEADIIEKNRYRRNLTDSCRSQELQRCNHRSFSSSIQTIIGYVDGAWRYFFTRRTSLDG